MVHSRRHRWATYFATGGSFSPTDIAGLELWLKADAITGLDDGDPVETWPDSSGNGNNLTQGTPAARPTYRTGIQNGLPIVRCDGTDDLLTDAFTLIQPVTFSLVFAFQSPPILTFCAIADGNTSLGLLLDVATSNPALPVTGTVRVYAGSGVQTTAGVVQDGVFGIATGISAGAGSLIRYLRGNQITGNAGAGTADGFTVGSRGGGGNYSPVDIAEAVLYDTALSAADITQVEDYLAAKWATA